MKPSLLVVKGPMPDRHRVIYLHATNGQSMALEFDRTGVRSRLLSL
ncbi:MAG: hypothetical protein ACFB01_12740 [Cohaesibacteraceae bacterium]